MLTELDAAAIRRWCEAATDSVAAHRVEIDQLNVFPIPDGDTGTNLSMTLRSAADQVAAHHASGAGPLLAVMARGAVFGARGNSGVILSQVLTGLATAVGDSAVADAQLLAVGLRRASEAAYAAVARPVEGTMLSVLRAAADAACQQCAAGATSLAAVIETACRAADIALRRTPEQLTVLAEAGVVDAGGQGLVLVLDALALVVTGRERPAGELDVSGPSGTRGQVVLERARETGSAAFGYEVQYLLRAGGSAVAVLRDRLAALGDSLVVADAGDGLYKVHVHVNDAGAAIEAAVEAGVPSQITVTRFADQVGPTGVGAERSGVAIVAVAPGVGLADLFRAEGVFVVEGGPTQNPSTVEVLQQIADTNAAQVVLLPNASAIGGVAELAAEQARALGVTVAVVPTKSPLQGLAAVAVHDSSRRFDDDVIALAEAAAATRFAEVTVAVRESLTYAGRCQAGDVLGLIDGEVVEIGSDVAAVGVNLVDRLVAVGGELVTVLVGADEHAAAAAAHICEHIRTRHPWVEVNCFTGGQPHFPLLIGVE